MKFASVAEPTLIKSDYWNANVIMMKFSWLTTQDDDLVEKLHTMRAIKHALVFLCFVLLCLCHVFLMIRWLVHYNDVIMGAIASEITSLTIVYSIVYWAADQRKHQSSASLAFVQGIHRGPVNSPHKWPVMRKVFPFDDVIMVTDPTNDFLSTIPISWNINLIRIIHIDRYKILHMSRQQHRPVMRQIVQRSFIMNFDDISPPAPDIFVEFGYVIS